MPDVHFPDVPGAASASNAPRPPSPGEEPSSRGRLSIDAPIARIVATAGGKTVLDQDVPGLVERPEYGLFKGMSMRKLASMSNGKITKQILDRVSQDLTKLSSSPTPGSAPN